MMRRTIAALAIAALLLPGAALAQMKGMTGADEKELAAYRLSVPTLNKVVSAMRTMLAEMKKDPKFQEMTAIAADIEALEKKDELTDAEQQRLEALTAKKDALEDSMGGAAMGNAKTLSDMEAEIRKVPAMMTGLNAAGLTPREYSKFMLSMIQAGMVAGFKKAGMLKEIPKEVPPENVTFMEEHEAELKALQQEMAAATKKGGGN